MLTLSSNRHTRNYEIMALGRESCMAVEDDEATAVKAPT